MSKSLFVVAVVVAVLGACSKKEVAPVEQPVSAEPVFEGKYN